ncbi:hypothetical protein KSP39_PZI021815 [Platanthera zijinensis]|uniref:Uncharacterized protein n=1 Tax=Platanthera zijinensis TaxID=2320716 RepID=A0AAP0AYD4_9ASPA
METPAPDYILVPLSFIIMGGYHAWLLRRIIHRPNKPIAGINSINLKNRAKAENGDQTLHNRIMATALMAWAPIMLGSSIAVLMANAHCLEQSDREMLGGLAARCFCLAAYLLAAFLLSVLTGRYYSRARMLITLQARCGPMRAKEYVASVVNRRSWFWAMGVRACYLAVPLYLWMLFGSTQLFAGCIGMIVIMYFIDTHSDWEEGEGQKKMKEPEESVKVEIAEPQSVSRRDREISSVELLEIIVIKDSEDGDEKKKKAPEESVNVEVVKPQSVSRSDRELSSVELLEIIVVKNWDEGGEKKKAPQEFAKIEVAEPQSASHHDREISLGGGVIGGKNVFVQPLVRNRGTEAQ